MGKNPNEIDVLSAQLKEISPQVENFSKGNKSNENNFSSSRKQQVPHSERPSVANVSQEYLSIQQIYELKQKMTLYINILLEWKKS